MSQLSPLLRQIAKKATHPNTLLYTFQRDRAGRLFETGQLGGGGEAVALAAPGGQGQSIDGSRNGEGREDGDGDGALMDDGKGSEEGGKEDLKEVEVAEERNSEERVKGNEKRMG